MSLLVLALTAAGAPSAPAAECPTCALNSLGQLDCCAEGASWFGECGPSKGHTAAEGVVACREGEHVSMPVGSLERSTREHGETLPAASSVAGALRGLPRMCV